LSTLLRRNGQITDCFLSGKLDKQFKKAKTNNSDEIISIYDTGNCRVYRPPFKALDCTLDELTQYFQWLYDETDSIPDPPEYMILNSSSPFDI